MLVLSRKNHESIIIGDNIEIKIIGIEGDLVRIGIDAPRDINVHRKEVYIAIKEENQLAAQTKIDLSSVRPLVPIPKGDQADNQ
ncbi:carbon storage regulator CsrA [Brevibacillus sp. SYSU BS000544]|uniref:carbon storage regulator CsrA n=1 Tax=Brevibacillus sp. SYSU BS000544 TaxID=3416443 RepID=UPI003CE5BE18